ncbi:MAG TPA: glyoxalase superfamily protein [Gemmatimonadaceae bacterium]|nr:glyoxalase superfamily protein [Gemmatimonadaceae bacterium]
MERAVPVLPGDDVTAARKFYSDGLGFEVSWEASKDGKNGLIGFRRNGIELTIDCPMSGHGRDACVSILVDNADAYYQEWQKSVEVKNPPRDEDWGARTFGVTDPFGNTIFVIGPPTAAKH